MFATLRQRDFALVWTAGLISLTGDWMLNIALPIYVYALTRSVLVLSVTAILSLLPRMALAPLAGVFADRWSRKRLMIASDVLLALALTPLLLVRQPDQVWIVFVVSFVSGCLEQFFAPAESALLPSLVPEDLLVSANALGGVNSNTARLVGPALGGLVMAWVGLPGVVVGDGVSFLLAALMIALISVSGRGAPAPAPAVAPATGAVVAGGAPNSGASNPGTPRGGIWHAWLDGVRLVPRRPLSIVFVATAITSFGEGLFGVLLVVFVYVVLRGGALQLGWLMSGQAVGGLLGGLVIGWIGRRFRPARLYAVGMLLFGLLDLIIVNAPGLLPPIARMVVPGAAVPVLFVVIGLFVVVGIPGAASQAGFNTLVQTAVPDRYLGRVFGLLMAVMSLMALGGMVLAGGLGDQVGPVPLLNIQGGGYVVAGLIALAALGAGTRWARPSSAPERAAVSDQSGVSALSGQ